MNPPINPIKALIVWIRWHLIGKVLIEALKVQMRNRPTYNRAAGRPENWISKSELELIEAIAGAYIPEMDGFWVRWHHWRTELAIVE